KRVAEIVSAQAIAMQLQQEEEHGAAPGLPTYDSLLHEETHMVPTYQTQQEDEERIRQLNAVLGTRYCVLCTETIPIPKFPALMNCKHEPQVCADCYKSW